MLHAKFQDHRTSCSGDFFKGFHHTWAWRPSWLIYQDHSYKPFVPPFPRRLQINLTMIDQAVSVEMFENGGHIHV